jgi:hypothetical protein
MAYELVAMSPLLYILAMGVLAFALQYRENPRLQFLGCFCACILFSFIAISFRTRAGGHWPFPGYISLMGAMGMVWQIAEAAPWGRTYRILFRLSVGLASLMTLTVYLLLINPDVVFHYVANRPVTNGGVNKGQTVTSKDLAEIYGYEELAQRVEDVQRDMNAQHPSFVFTDSYTLSSIIAFYSGLDTHVARGSLLGREYFRWDHWDQMMGQDAVYVDLAPWGKRPDIVMMLQNAFERVVPEPPMQVYKEGQEVRDFYLIRCYGFKQKDGFQPTGGVAQ